MAIEKQAIPMRSGSEDPVELEIVQQPDEETELFVQPDGSIVRGSDMEEETPSKFGENLAEILDDRELNTIAAELVSSYEEDLESREDVASSNKRKGEFFKKALAIATRCF